MFQFNLIEMEDLRMQSENETSETRGMNKKSHHQRPILIYKWKKKLQFPFDSLSPLTFRAWTHG
jgi:hypothetical protein